MASMKKNTAIAIDLGASNVRVALISDQGKILCKLREETTKIGSSGAVVTRQIIRLIDELLAKNEADEFVQETKEISAMLQGLISSLSAKLKTEN